MQLSLNDGDALVDVIKTDGQLSCPHGYNSGHVDSI